MYFLNSDVTSAEKRNKILNKYEKFILYYRLDLVFISQIYSSVKSVSHLKEKNLQVRKVQKHLQYPCYRK